MNLAEIAAELGYADAIGAYRAIQAALQTILPEGSRDEYRRIEVARLDALQEASWEQAMQGDAKAAGVALRCIAARSKLLGLEVLSELDTRMQEAEPAYVELDDVLDGDSLAAARRLRDRMHELSALRSGEIEATSWD